MARRQNPSRADAALMCCGALGAIAVIWVAYTSVSGALSTGLVPVGTLRTGARDVVYAPWRLVAPLAMGLLFVLGACIALAVPRLRMLTLGAPPLVALFLCGLLFMLMEVFCSSLLGNAIFAATAIGLVVLLRGLARLEKRAAGEEI